MTFVALLLLVIGFVGMRVLLDALHHHPLFSELPAKTAITLLFVFAAFMGSMGWSEVWGGIVYIAFTLSVLFILGPLGAKMFARAGLYAGARFLQLALYWTPEGRQAIGATLANIALYHGEPESAALFDANNHVIDAKIAFAQQRYRDVLEIGVLNTTERPPALRALRARAYARLEYFDEAQREFETGMSQYELQKPDPDVYRDLVLAQADILSVRGDPVQARDVILEKYIAGQVFEPFELLAFGCRVNYQPEAELRMLVEGGPAAPRGMRKAVASRIAELGGNPQVVYQSTKRGMPATYSFAAVLVLAYLAQSLADNILTAKHNLLTIFDPSSLIAAYFLDVPIAPFAEAWWRFLTYGFVHGNLIHILMNVWVFIDIGGLLEKRRSWAHLVTSFAVGTAGGAWLTRLFDDGPLILVGASGGVLGLAGMVFADALLAKQEEDQRLVQVMVRWMALIMLISVAVPGISLFGHAGGIVAGFALGAALHYVRPLQRFMPIAGVLAIGVMVFSLAEALRLVLPFFS